MCRQLFRYRERTSEIVHIKRQNHCAQTSQDLVHVDIYILRMVDDILGMLENVDTHNKGNVVVKAKHQSTDKVMGTFCVCQSIEARLSKIVPVLVLLQQRRLYTEFNQVNKTLRNTKNRKIHDEKLVWIATGYR